MICFCVSLDRFIVRLLATDSTSNREHFRRQGHFPYNCGAVNIAKLERFSTSESATKA